MDDLLKWLGEQLDEDERIARAATPGPWEWKREHGEPWQPEPDGWLDYSGEYLAAAGDGATLFGPGMTPHADAVHIAAHDPARVLREIEAKRRIIAEVVPEIDGMEDRIDGEWGAGDPTERESMALLRLLALPYADRSGFRDDWRP
ncbi:DUF6221 family protein [Streptomyces sp. NBC_00723]|uniref:DUF6221 family protein n=1 Tax=Streptomyces sp. NBC_00723 TaxID=2903673 RepID=UPI00386B79B0